MAPKYSKDQPAGFTNRIERVAIVGASGHVGKRIVNSLLATGRHTLTVITRADSTSKFPEGVRSVAVDYSDEAKLVSALQGQQFLIISLNVSAPPDTHSKIVRAAAKAGVPYVMPNWYGGELRNEPSEIDGGQTSKGLAYTREIEELGVSSWVLLSCGFWYEWSLGGGEALYGIDIAKKEATLLDGGNQKICTSTWDQCGRAVATVLQLKELPEDEHDKSLTVSSFKNGQILIKSFNLSQRDMLDAVQKVTGTTDKDWVIKEMPAMERWEMGKQQLAAGDFEGFPRLLYSAGFLPGSATQFDTKVMNKELGLPEEDLDAHTKVAVDMAITKKDTPYEKNVGMLARDN